LLLQASLDPRDETADPSLWNEYKQAAKDLQ
jgi:hypothetical protein